MTIVDLARAILSRALFCFGVFFTTFAYGYDPHVSIGINATALGFSSPGGSFEYATAFGKRAVIGAELGVTDAPSSGAPRESFAGINGRLVYSMGLNSQWYPTLFTRGRLNNQSWETGFGVGMQIQLTDAAGLYTDIRWSTQQLEVHHKLGVRIWLDRLNSLDRRVKRSQPVGAVYTGKVPTYGANEHAQVETSASVAPQSSANRASDFDERETLQWFAHLGLFSRTHSLTRLEQDSRLSAYQGQFVHWFDSERGAYRLLLGPYTEQKAKAVVEQLQQVDIDSFVYFSTNKHSAQ